MPILGGLVKRAMKLNKRINKPRFEPMHYQEKTLKRLIRKASGTAFGEHYNFKDILKADDFVKAFQENIPVHDYDKLYEKWWHRTLEQETNICWPGDIKLYALSSGTTGSASKHIPITNDMFRSIRRAGIRMFYNTTQFDFDKSFYEKDMLMFGGSTSLQQGNGYQAGDLSGINTGKLPLWVRRFYKPGGDISSMNDWNERINRIAKEAPNWDIGIVAGIPSWIQLMIERVIEYNELSHIHEIWPNFQVYVSGGVAFEPYKKSFEKLLGKPIHYMDTYLASEGFIAIQSRLGTTSMAMITDNGIFYEFVPFNEDNFKDGEIVENPEVRTIETVEAGVDYALLLSSCGGAWRYMIGDTVRFTDVSRAEIVVTGRTKHFLSICGEHLSVGNMNDAIKGVEEELNIEIKEFTVSGIELDNGKFAHKWYIGTETGHSNEVVQAVLDEKICELNDDYITERASVLGMQLEIVPSNSFYSWFESKGKLGGQNKVPRVMKQDQFADWESFVQTRIK